MNTISTTRAIERCERLAALGSAPPWWRVFAVRRWLRAYRVIMALDISVHAEMLRSIYTPESIRDLGRRSFSSVRMVPKSERGPFVEVIERVQIGADGEPDADTYSIEVIE